MFSCSLCSLGTLLIFGLVFSHAVAVIHHERRRESLHFSVMQPRESIYEQAGKLLLAASSLWLPFQFMTNSEVFPFVFPQSCLPPSSLIAGQVLCGGNIYYIRHE